MFEPDSKQGFPQWKKIRVTLAKKVKQVKKVMNSMLVVFINILNTADSFHRVRLSMWPSNETIDVGHSPEVA